MPAGRPTKYKSEMCEQAYEALRTGGTLAHVAVALDVDEHTVQAWIEKHVEFSTAIKKGLAHAKILWLEEKEKKMSSGSWIFSMKNIFQWRDTQTTEHTGGISVNVNLNLTGNDPRGTD